MAGNDISKQLQINFLPENLRPQGTEQGLFDVTGLRPSDSVYQTALKKSLDVENRRTATPPPESKTREQYQSDKTSSRAEEQGPSRSERFSRETPEAKQRQRSEPERPVDRPAPTQTRQSSEESAPASTVSTESRVETDSTQKIQESQPADNSSLTSFEESTENSAPSAPPVEVNQETVDPSGSVNDSLLALSEVVAQLLQDSSGAPTEVKPPTSFGKDFLQQIHASQSVNEATANAPIIEGTGDGKLSVPSELILGLIANQVGKQSKSGAPATPVDPAAIAATIQKVVSELVTSSTEAGADPATEQVQAIGEELIEQIVESFGGTGEDDEQSTEVTAEGSTVETADIVSTATGTESNTQSNNGNQVVANAPPVLINPESNPESTSGTNPDTTESSSQNASVTSVVAPESLDGISPSEEGETTSEANATEQSEAAARIVPVIKETTTTKSNTTTEAGQSSESTTPSVTEIKQGATSEVSRSVKSDSTTAKQGTTDAAPPVEEGNRLAQTKPVTAITSVTPSIGLEQAASKVTAEGATATKTEVAAQINGIEASPSTRTVSTDRAASRPAVPPSTLPPVQSQEFLEKLSDSVRIADKNNQQLKVRLTPPHLGSMNIEVTRHDGVITARLEVQSTAAQQQVLDQMAGLKESLQQQGHHIERIEVTVQDPNRPDQNQQQSSQRDDDQEPRREPRQQQQQQQQRSNQQEQGDEEADVTLQSRAPWSMDNIDVEI
ncbi:Flagellar hook-length control protein FliK [Polystyrenella longa]|uniref:Flagellar hook-length control protein FliK n=1 Tax=Polystyrenella longa TaxID=2528007 RepID=A0A518CIR1_9PLAN|nr:flagellar hook-length control protein FliK [Polystyrenella longa]QDU79119.1 Flagellar hook-length control protein FliK [Polystyrenella longa]